MQDLGVETSLIKYNILENDLNNIANAVDTIRLKNHPVKLKKKIFWKYLRSHFKYSRNFVNLAATFTGLTEGLGKVIVSLVLT